MNAKTKTLKGKEIKVINVESMPRVDHLIPFTVHLRNSLRLSKR